MVNILRPILAVLIIFIPLYPKFPLQAIPGTYVAIRLDDLVVAAAVLIWLIYQLKNRFPVLKLNINRLFLVYFAAIILSSLHAVLIFQNHPTHILLLHLFRRFEYISLFFITISAIKSKNDFKFTYISLLLTTFLVSLYGYGQKFFGLPVISTMNSEFAKGQLLQMDYWARINSTFAGHYDLAAFMSTALVLVGGAIFLVKKPTYKIISLIVWAIGFHILILTASRISVFAFWGAAILGLLFLKKYLWIVPVSLLVVFSMFTSKDLNQRLLATLPTIKLPQLPQIQKPQPTTIPSPTPTTPPIAIITTAPSQPATGPTLTPTPTITRHQIEEFPEVDADAGVARSGEIRFKAEWPRAINAYRKNPLNGTGPGSITLATDNDYLRNLGETGIFGIASIAIIFFWFVQKTFKNRQPLNFIFLAALTSFLANAVFIDVFEASKTAYFFWIIMGLYHQSLTYGQK